MAPQQPDPRPEPSDERWIELLTRDWREPGDLAATLRRIAETARKAFGADLCVIFAINPVTRRFVPEPGVGGDLWPDAAAEAPLRTPRQHGLTQRVIEEGYLSAEDAAARPEEDRGFYRKQGIRSFAAVALHTIPQARPFAVLYVDYREPQLLGALERQLRRFAQLASRELQITWFLRRYRLVGQIGQWINQRPMTAERLFHELWQHTGRIIDTTRCFLLGVYRPEDNTLDLFARVDGHEIVECGRPVDGPVRWLLKEDGVHINAIADETASVVQRVGRLPGDLPWEPQSLVFLPLLTEGRPLGVLSVQHPSANAFDDEDRYVLELLAAHASLAVSNLRLYSHLDRLHRAGQTLTRDLESERVLQAVVDSIRETTRCDVAMLYPYNQATDLFSLPPERSGDLIDASVSQPRFAGQSAVARFVLRQSESLFEEDAAKLIERLGSEHVQQEGGFQRREGILSVAALPLKVSDEAVGTLFVNYRNRQHFLSDAGQRQLIEGLAGYAAIAIKNAREFGTEQRRYIKNLEALRIFDRALSRSNDLQELLDTILQLAHDRLADRLAPDEASILLYEPERNVLRTTAAIGEHRSRSLEQVLRPEEGIGITLEVLRTKKTILISDIERSEWHDRRVEVGGRTRCELDVPLLDADSVVGILNLESQIPNAFDQDDVRLMEALAGQAVLAVKKAQAFDEKARALREERRLREDEETLIQLGKELTRQLDVNALLDLILQRAIENTRAQAGVLALVDPKKRDLVIEAEYANPGAEQGRRWSRDCGILGYVARTGEVVNADLTRPPWQDLHVAEVRGMKSELAVPLKDGDQVRGVLNVESPHERFFSSGNERLLAGLAGQAIIALQNAERFARAQKRQERLKALDEVGRKVIEHLGDSDHVMEAVVRHALRLTGATISDLDLFDEDDPGRDPYAQRKWTFHYRARRGAGTSEGIALMKEDPRDPRATPPPRGIMQCVARTKRALLVPGDAEKDRRYKGEAGIHSELAVPLLNGQTKLLGVLDVTSIEPNAFDYEDNELLELFAAQAVIAIENNRSYQRSERRSKRFEILHRAGQRLAQITDLVDLEKAYDIVVEIAREHFSSEVVVRRFEPATLELARVRSADTGGPPLRERIPWDDPLNGRVARDRITLVVNDADNPLPHIGPFPRSNPQDHSFVVSPILFKTSYYGNLALSHAAVNHFRDADVKLIEGLAQQLALTINRLEEVEARQAAEKQAMEMETMGEVGRQTYELMHRLGNDLGLVRTSARKIQARVQKAGTVDPEIKVELAKIHSDIRGVLGVSRKLANELSEAPGGQPDLYPVQEVLEHAVRGLSKPETILVELNQSEDQLAVKVDYRRFADALLNLLSNAVEAMPEGGRLTVGAARSSADVKIWVKDTGRGISRGALKRLFDLGYTTKPGSSGFGLWSVKRTVVASGGRISVDTRPGAGTTFEIVLPRAEEYSGD